jgi:DNA-binding TFAR19-related protein (PDSD5 family)
VGAEHYVRDGHHRVSVARAGGAEAIEAQVVELAQESGR